jgi:mannitol/fructose-specific phosphotransferase system IIA component (Ntr-type)
MKLHKLLSEDMVLARLEGRTRDDVLRELAEHVRARAPLDEGLFGCLMAREELGTTAIGAGVAIPHCKAPGLKAAVLALGLSREGVPFASVDGWDVHVVFLVVSPLENPSVNLRVLASIAKLVRKSRDLAAKLLEAPTAGEALRVLREEEDGVHA